MDPNQLTALLITHEHHDHIKGLKLFLKRYSIPLFASEETLLCSGISSQDLTEFTPLETGTSFQIGDLKVDPFSLPHDAMETYGFILRANGVKISYATDLGFASKLVKERMKESDVLIIEANHDSEMLKSGPYPWFLKQRVIGQQGHLSNESMGQLVEDIIHEETRYLILAHLSQVNNRPELARKQALRAARVGGSHPKIIVSSQHEISERIEI